MTTHAHTSPERALDLGAERLLALKEAVKFHVVLLRVEHHAVRFVVAQEALRVVAAVSQRAIEHAL